MISDADEKCAKDRCSSRMGVTWAGFSLWRAVVGKFSFQRRTLGLPRR